MRDAVGDVVGAAVGDVAWSRDVVGDVVRDAVWRCSW